MVRIFIDTASGKVSDHYEFEAVPRVGEIVFLETNAGEIKLGVLRVEHYPPAKGDVMDRMSSVTLQCEVLEN